MHLVGIERQAFAWIYQCGFATLAHVILAIRREHRARDGYLSRAVRKLFDHAYIAKLVRHPFDPDIYFVSGRCVKGRAAAVSLFGDDSRVVRSPSKVPRAHVEHALALAWIRIYAHLSSQARAWEVEYLDQRAITWLDERLPLLPDAALVVDKGPDRDERRLFLVEYQRWESARRTTKEKLVKYLELLPEYERRLGADRSWVLLILERPDQWVASLVKQLEEERMRGTFFFAPSDKLFSMRPDGLWTEPVFYLPGQSGPCSLFEVGTEGGVIYGSR